MRPLQTLLENSRLDDDEEMSFLNKLGEQQFVDEEAAKQADRMLTPKRLTRHLEDTATPPVSILEQPITFEGTKQITRGLLTTADEALMREGKKSGLQIFLDTLNLVPRAVRALGEGIGTEAAKISLDPAEALPATLSLAGGVAGAVTGNPALAYAGGIAGRSLGRYLLDWHKDRNFGTYEDALDIAGSLTGANLTAAPIGGAIRLALKKSGVELGKPVGLGLAKTIVERSHVFTNPDSPTALKVAQTLQESAQAGQALRNQAYADAKKMKLQEQWAGDTTQDVLDDYTLPAKTKMQFIDERLSIAEDEQLAQTLHREQVMANSNPGVLVTSGDTTQENLLGSQKRDVLRATQQDRLDLVNSVIQSPKTTLPLETKAGAKRRLLSYTEQQETERIGSGAWKKSLNDVVNNSVEAMRTVIGLTPEILDNELIHELKGTIGFIPSQFDTQVGFRKSGNALLQHTGDVLLHANETVRVASRNIKSTASALFDKYEPTTDTFLHLAAMQSKGDIMATYDSAKDALTRLAKQDALAETTSQVQKAQAAGLKSIQKAVEPRDISADLQKEVLGAAKAAGHFVHPDEAKDFMHALNFMDEWRQQTSDPLYGIAYTMNPDPQWLATYNATYFLPTSAAARQYADIRSQREMLENLMGGVNKTNPVGAAQFARYADAVKAATRKESIAKRAHEASEKTMSNMYSMIAEKGVGATKTFMGAFLPSSAKTILYDSNPRLAAEEYIDGFLKKAVYDNAMPKAHETLQKFVDANVLNPATADATKRAASWAQGVMLDQYGLRKSAKLQNISNALAGTPLGNGKFEKAVDFITQTHYMLNIAMKPRFYALNALQNVTGLLPLVDTESYAHGLKEFFFNQEEAKKVAREAGVLDPASFQTESLKQGLFSGATAERQNVPSTFDKVLDTVGTPARLSEEMNRTIAYHAGLYHANTYGLTGNNAHMKALDIVKDAHYLYDVANRPSASNTPLGGLMTRYTTFSKNYASFLSNQIRGGDVSRIGSTVAGLLAVSGSKGVPLYGMVQWELAKLGYDHVLPDIPAVDQAMGLDLGAATGLLPDLPTSPEEALGVFYKEGEKAVRTISEDKAPLGSRIAAAGIGLMGSPLRAAITAAQEGAQGGVTTSPAGREVKSERDPGSILLSGLGLKLTPRGLQADANKRLASALGTQNARYLDEEVAKIRQGGVVNTTKILKRLQARAKSAENTSTLDLVTGIPSLQ